MSIFNVFSIVQLDLYLCLLGFFHENWVSPKLFPLRESWQSLKAFPAWQVLVFTGSSHNWQAHLPPPVLKWVSKELEADPALLRSQFSRASQIQTAKGLPLSSNTMTWGGETVSDFILTSVDAHSLDDMGKESFLRLLEYFLSRASV